MKALNTIARITAVAVALGLAAQDPTPTTITYQGLLTAGSRPANGVYDLDLHVFDAASGGNDVGSVLAGGTTVSNGVVTVRLDFKDDNPDRPLFAAGARWMEVRMRPTALPNAPFSVLLPRQPVTSAPKAVFAYNAARADIAGQAGQAEHALAADTLLGGVSDKQLPANIPRLENTQTFSGINSFSGFLLAPNPGNQLFGTFTGNGVGLNSLNASALASGTVADTRLSANVALLGANQSFSGFNLFKSQVGIGTPPSEGSLAVAGAVHLSDSELYLRPGTDHRSGLAWYGATKPFGGISPDGPVLFGATGGALGTAAQGQKPVLVWNAAGHVGINTAGPVTALQVEDFDATLRLKNWNDTVGGFVGDSFSALQLGLYNPTSTGFGAVPANAARTFFALSADGRVGSTVNGFIGNPVYRNLLDDGNGQVAVNSVVRTADTGSSLEFQVAPTNSAFGAALRIFPALGAAGSSPNIVAGASGNTIASGVYGSSILGGGAPNGFNTIGANAASIAGGFNNTVEGGSDGGFVGGGTRNRIVTGSLYAAVAGGFGNIADKGGLFGILPGGVGNVAAGSAAFAAGYNARAVHDGTFVWADNYAQSKTVPHPVFASTTPNEFAIRATGGFRFVDGYFFNVDLNTYMPIGLALAPNSGTWTQLSDRNAKKNFSDVRPREVLEKVARLPVQEWQYKSETGSVRHIGPMAQDFWEAFHVGQGETTIDAVDPDGVALAAIQGLNQKVEEQAAEIRELKALVGRLARQVDSMARREAAALPGTGAAGGQP